MSTFNWASTPWFPRRESEIVSIHECDFIINNDSIDLELLGIESDLSSLESIAWYEGIS